MHKNEFSMCKEAILFILRHDLFFHWSLIEQAKVEDNGKMDHTTVFCAEQACMNYFDRDDKTLSKGIFFFVLLFAFVFKPNMCQQTILY